MTSKQVAALELIDKAREEIESELAKPQNLITERGTLEDFLRELDLMEGEIKDNRLPAPAKRRRGMGRVIAVSWPLSSPLGETIVSAEHAYLAL